MLPTRDNRFVVALAPYPSQQVKTAQVFRCGLVEEQMAEVARRWDTADLEAAGQDAVLPISMIRAQEEFQASDHWRYHASTPLIHIEKIGESDPEPLPPSPRPLSGVRALGMTHVVAGPTVLRQLAAARRGLSQPEHARLCRGVDVPHAVGRRRPPGDSRLPASRRTAKPSMRLSVTPTSSSRTCGPLSSPSAPVREES